MAAVTQRPTPPNVWLHNGAEDYTRIFSDYIIRPESATPWEECTDEERKEFERTHPNPDEDTQEQL